MTPADAFRAKQNDIPRMFQIIYGNEGMTSRDQQQTHGKNIFISEIFQQKKHIFQKKNLKVSMQTVAINFSRSPTERHNIVIWKVAINHYGIC